jgi:hypothetical protein
LLRFERTKNNLMTILLSDFVVFGLATALGFEEKDEGFIVLAVATGLIAVHEFEGAGLLAEAGEGDPGAGGGVGGERSLVLLFGVLAELVADGGAFHAGETHLTPFGDGHGFDERDFVRGFGAEGGFEVGDELVKDLAGLAFKKYDCSDHAVAEVVADGTGFAFGGDGAPGSGAVATGGGALGMGAGFGGGGLVGEFVLMVHVDFDCVLGGVVWVAYRPEVDTCFQQVTG